MTTHIIEQIDELKQRRKAVILAHNYQLGEVQDIADFVGDSLELSRKAAELDADVIVFCGVHFMAETAAILSPGRTVLLPDLEAGCPMADMITGAQLQELKQAHPGAAVVCYVNSTAEVKAESDCCCTSANAVEVVRSFGDREVLFVPDQYLGDYVAQQLGRSLVLWPGYCPTHAKILPETLRQLRREHPNAVILAHPECPRPVREVADAVLSTGGMCRHVRESTAREFVLATEEGILHRLSKEYPDKTFMSAGQRCVCPNMKKINLQKVLWSLQDMSNRIVVPEAIRVRAKSAIDRMLSLNA